LIWQPLPPRERLFFGSSKLEIIHWREAYHGEKRPSNEKVWISSGFAATENSALTEPDLHSNWQMHVPFRLPSARNKPKIAVSAEIFILTPP
jgi:hypothetical protein